MRRAGTRRARVMLVHRRRPKKERKEKMTEKEARELISKLTDEEKLLLCDLLECLRRNREPAESHQDGD